MADDDLPSEAELEFISLSSNPRRRREFARWCAGARREWNEAHPKVEKPAKKAKPAPKNRGKPLPKWNGVDESD